MGITDAVAAFERLESKRYDPSEVRIPKGRHGGGRWGSSLTNAVADEAHALASGGKGRGYGITEARLVRKGDHRDHPMKAGNFPEGDPRNDPSYARYVEQISKKIRAALPTDATDKRFGAKRDGKPLLDGEGKQVYVPSRRVEHNRIIDRIMASAAHVPADHQALMLGGLPGAGKSTLLKNLGKGLGGFLKVDDNGEPTNAIIINPDEMKSLLLNGKDVNGKPLVPRTPGLTDGEHASLVHEESSHLAAMLARRAMAEGKNVIFDITLGDAEKANAKYLHNDQGTGAVDLGYQVHHVFVEGSMATSLHRAGLRHKNNDRDTGQRTFSGRYVDYEHIRSEANQSGALDSDGKVAASKNRVESDKLISRGVFTSAARYDSKTGDLVPIPIPKQSTKGLAALAELAKTVNVRKSK